MLHVKAQNAGLIIRNHEDSVLFEAFELSPLNESVMAAKGRLRRSFPGCAVNLDQHVLSDVKFQTTIAKTIAKMSHQNAPNMQPIVKKAGQIHEEDRDTTHPGLVTELLMGNLQAIGKFCDVHMIWKNTREEVLWSNCRSPWRRSPVWLLVRVSLQLEFTRPSSTTELGSDTYKTFMVFFLAQIMKKATTYSLKNEKLHSMQAKLSRRLIKLDLKNDFAGLDIIHSIISTTQNIIEQRWRNVIQSSPALDIPQSDSGEFSGDTFHHIPALDHYISQISQRDSSQRLCSFKPTFYLPNFDPDRLPTTFRTYKGPYTIFALSAFENWVERHLPHWLYRNMDNETTCCKLKDLLKEYHRLATSHELQHNPERFSVMVLTTMELWIACDKSACKIHNLIVDYDPNIPIQLLSSLHLSLKSQMERLSNIEEYILQRQKIANQEAPSILFSFGHSGAFGVRYFQESPRHQDLLQEIESYATKQREKKKRELSQKKEQYRVLMEKHHETECESILKYDRWNEEYVKEHSVSCSRCALLSQARSISILVHEWPLPRSKLDAASTVFELSVPPTFSAWRDATVFVLYETLGCEYSSIEEPNAHHTLQNYQGISSFFSANGSMQRIGLLSQVKPHSRTHRKAKLIDSVTENDICVQNGLNFMYFDNTMGVFMKSFKVTNHVPESCTHRLPDYASSLQKFLHKSPTIVNGLAPNEVMSSQSECPPHMKLDEYRALGTIPLGNNIQWMNILVQVAAPSINFKATETNLLLLQTISQAGPPLAKSAARLSHSILTNAEFGRALLGRLQEGLLRVQENWESSRVIASFTQMAARLLSLATSREVLDDCLLFLATARDVTIRWMKSLRIKAQSTTVESQRLDILSKVVEIALTCIGTFDVEQGYLQDMLGVDREASIFIQASITVQEHLSQVSSRKDHILRVMFDRWQTLCYRALCCLRSEICEQRKHSLDSAIALCWQGYESGLPWEPVQFPYEHWVSSVTTSNANSAPLLVHYNLLTAELLVNGLPLARLPSQYKDHPTYSTLFGSTILDVMPSPVLGMDFSVKSTYAGHTVHLGMESYHNGNCVSFQNMMVKAIDTDNQYDLIPSAIFRHIFPLSFIDEHVHWYDHKENKIEFRSINSAWPSSSSQWQLVPYQGLWQLSRNGIAVVGLSSTTARSYASILKAIEDPEYLHILYDQQSKQLEIDLPRVQLSFFVEQGGIQIQSRQFRGFYVDPDQEFGTLIGLQNKLVCKNDKRGTNRIIIIPDGKVTYRKTESHILVNISRHAVSDFHVYHVDELLGRLLDNGSVYSKLFLCYLHAITSYCVPDPLSRHTGTEQALSILRSGAVRSFDYLSENSIAMLLRIAKINPSRHYYPAHERVMQQITWDPHLDALSQHGLFHTSVQTLLEQAKRTQTFCLGSKKELPRLNFVVQHLLDQYLLRSSTDRVSGFGAECHTVQHDVVYKSRDRGQTSDRSRLAFIAANSIFQNLQLSHKKVANGFSNKLWKDFVACASIHGSEAAAALPPTEYDSFWLQQYNKCLYQYWSPLHFRLVRLKQEVNKFDIMIWLSTLAFSTHSDIDVIQILIAVWNVASIAAATPPETRDFKTSLGFEADSARLTLIIGPASLPIDQSPEAGFVKMSGETKRRFNERRQTQFHQNKTKTISRFVDSIHNQWPCDTPSVPDGNDFGMYLNVGKAMKSVQELFKEWFKNFQLRAYLVRLEMAQQSQRVAQLLLPVYIISEKRYHHHSLKRHIHENDVFRLQAPGLRRNHERLDLTAEFTPNPMNQCAKLDNLLARLDTKAHRAYEKSYVSALRDSVKSLQVPTTAMKLASPSESIQPNLEKNLVQCAQKLHTVYSRLESLKAGSRLKEIAMRVGQAPRVSPVFFLHQLNRKRWIGLPKGWQRDIVTYGLAILELQRAHRLLNSLEDKGALIAELSNDGHHNWNPEEFPEALLLEIESGIIIRDVQEMIWRQMRNPPLCKNSVMQLNMGEGKSSVIVPLVATSLADGTRLVRVIVGKPQSKQMLQMLVSKVGGLLNRRVCIMPFSRDLLLDDSQAKQIGEIYRDCMQNGDILLLQPEHVLSFKLMCLESLLTGRQNVADALFKTQSFFDGFARDIVDESDENFSVKFELIYTMGTQRPIELSPERWNIIHFVLSLIPQLASDVGQEIPSSMEVDLRFPEKYPRTRFLREDGTDKVINLLGKKICSTGFSGFPIAHQSEKLQQAVYRYITVPEVASGDVAEVEEEDEESFWNESTKDVVLLLRGLLAGGVLSFAFGAKRWRVNYGIDQTRRPRSRLAVPFRAKDNPAPRSEFSHPDVVILITSLSYYYGGLADEELSLAFEHLLKSDQAIAEYGEWTATAPGLPKAFRQLEGVNLIDCLQCVEQIFPKLRYSKGAIDYFLSHIVFPRELKEFPHKISASGWDMAQVRTQPVTGFSGTNDSRLVLPLSIQQLDLKTQKHTNALVLGHILQDENSIELMSHYTDEAEVSDSKRLISLVCSLIPAVRVILDVGAQVLEYTNLQVAQMWLDRTPDTELTKAVVYFNEHDELSVIDRRGRTELLQCSSFVNQLDLCLVFLDEAHTRGTDLKLPTNYRAAVTLGAGLTKDRLVQGMYIEIIF
jgi:hypothetical protein